MKKALIIFTLFLVAVSQNSAFAQYATKSQSDKNQESLYQQNNDSKKIGKGVHLTDAGKTMLITGASVAMTGVACFIGGAASYDSHADAHNTPVYPVFAIAGAAAGGLIALIGLPFYLSGQEKMNRYGSSHITFGNEGQKGCTGIFEMGLGIPNFLSLDAIGGYNFGKNFFMGAGLGYKVYLTPGLRYGGATASLPIYTNFRYSIGKKRIVPYIGASLGYDITNTGLYTGVEFGTRFRKIEAKRGESWWFGVKSEFISSDLCFLSLKVGRSF